MMKAVILFTLVAVGVGCTQTHKKATSETFIDREQRAIDQHKQLLVKAGRMSPDFGEAFIVLSQYGWHGDGNGYFGAYSFYQPAFEQANRAWFIGQSEILEGSDELWTGGDDLSRLKFDSSVIGKKVTLYMSWFEDGKYKGAEFTAKIIGTSDQRSHNPRDASNLLLDRRAPHHASMRDIKILPDNWTDMCACTNNFHPQFADGQPIVEQIK